MPRRRDENETAFDTLEELLRRDAERDGEPQPPKPSLVEKLAYRVNAGRKGGLKGGKARTAKLSAKKRREIAKKAAKKRWASKSDRDRP